MLTEGESKHSDDDKLPPIHKGRGRSKATTAARFRKNKNFREKYHGKKGMQRSATVFSRTFFSWKSTRFFLETPLLFHNTVKTSETRQTTDIEHKQNTSKYFVQTSRTLAWRYPAVGCSIYIYIYIYIIIYIYIEFPLVKYCPP